MSKIILLCDDEPHILRAAEIKFGRAGFEVICACDGEEGWQCMQEHLPDIVVTDCQMPRLSGIGLAERIHSDPRTSHIPVIMLTGKRFELSDRELRDKFNVVAIIGKPFSPRELLSRVETLLDIRPAELTPATV